MAALAKIDPGADEQVCVATEEQACVATEEQVCVATEERVGAATEQRLQRSWDPDELPVELVSAYAGDRALTMAEGVHLRTQRERRGSAFFSDLLYGVSHHYFAPELAEDLWHAVLEHKHLLSEQLGRNVRMTVATLDYLSNVTEALTSLTLISEAAISEIASLSMRDGMTGLFNHTSCYELLELEFKSHRRYGAGVSVILFDIDDFKAVNDAHGHQAGDQILIDVAKTLAEQVRDSDICCRFGGEEFVAILPFTSDPREAQQIAERVRVAVANSTWQGRSVTISAGVASCDHQTTEPEALIDKADRALYAAKRGGKNRVEVSGTSRRRLPG